MEEKQKFSTLEKVLLWNLRKDGIDLNDLPSRPNKWTFVPRITKSAMPVGDKIWLPAIIPGFVSVFKKDGEIKIWYNIKGRQFLSTVEMLVGLDEIIFQDIKDIFIFIFVGMFTLYPFFEKGVCYAIISTILYLIIGRYSYLLRNVVLSDAVINDCLKYFKTNTLNENRIEYLKTNITIEEKRDIFIETTLPPVS